MANGQPIELADSQRRFWMYALGGLAGLALLASFLEQDRRALLLSDMPEAFAVSEIGTSADEFGSTGRYPVVWGDRSSRPNGAASRRIGGRSAGALPVEPGPQTSFVAAPASGREPDSAALASVTLPEFSASGQETGAPPLALAAVSPGNLVSGPIGAIPIVQTPGPGPGPAPTPGPADPDPPVVPAIPEPASWLLMIIGVALLGASLRSKRALGCARVLAASPNRAS